MDRGSHATRVRCRSFPARSPRHNGPTATDAHSRALGDGLWELRFDLDKVAWRITYWFAPERQIVLLTVFRKQRMNEKAEVHRARHALSTCRSSHLAQEDD